MLNLSRGDLEPRTDETYPSVLLKHLLEQMMSQFAANGACLALLDENSGEMVIRLHIRTRAIDFPSPPKTRNGNGNSLLNRRTTIDLSTVLPNTGPLRAQSLEKIDVTPVQKNDLFPIGTSYSRGEDLIGIAWERNEAYIMRHEDYVSAFPTTRNRPTQPDATPRWYLVAPISEPRLLNEMKGRNGLPAIMGVVLLYQTTPSVGFQQKHRYEALDFTERIALYMQNDQLVRSQERTRSHMKRLQQISTAFPTNVRLANLVDDVYRFTSSVVDVSCMLLTLYDRDTDRIYDIFAVCDGKRMEGLPAQSVAPEERPLWWRIVQQEQRRLSLNIEDPEHENFAGYEELLTGVWGDQRKARSFLLLPMKMFTRAIGSLALTSSHPDAYGPEEILVLETMVQIITVSIENAKLYDKARHSLREARQREQDLAAMNSALQAVSSVLNIVELLHNFVESAAKLVHAEMSAFFQLSSDRQELIAQSLYATSQNKDSSTSSRDMTTHSELIEMIRLPFKGSILESLVNESFFSLDSSAIEELAQASTEGGVIMLREMGIKQMLMIPVTYQTELIGILAIQVIGDTRAFNPKEIGALLALCSQTASAIRNAQLFEEREDAYAELQRMDKLKDEFLVTASHELRTPLSAIKGYASLLQRQHARATPQQILRSVTKIAESTQQLSDLVVSMTDAAHLGASDKRIEMQIGPVQLMAAARLARDMLSASIEHKITLEVSPDLWVSCDPLRLRQVMTNLLDNAVKYSPLEAHIELIAEATTLDHLSLPEDLIDPERGNLPIVAVRVRDEGEGIYEEDQRKIFEKFVRASRSLTTAVRGTGLGLYICRRYIEAMGGRIWLERSTPGEGSTFAFYLPRIDAPAGVEGEHEAT
jgi:signal transduction histidine kinase